MDHTQQKLWEAVNVLIEEGTLRERVRAASTYLAYLRLKGDRAFPAFPELQQRLDALGDLSTGSLTDEAAEAYAKEILSLLLEATRLAGIPVGVTETLKAKKGDVH